MRINTFRRYRFSLDVWEPVVANDTNGTLSFEYSRTVPVSVVSGLSRTYAYSEESLPFSGMVRNVKNPYGESVFVSDGQEYDMFVFSSEPMIDVYGDVTGYRATLRRNPPAIPAGING